MSQEDAINWGVPATVANPILGTAAAIGGSLTGGAHSGQSSWQSGQGPENWTPEQLATLLGTYAGQVGYDSNKAGSFEGNYNSRLNTLTPDMLIKRYSELNNPNYFNTGLDQLQKQAFDTAKSILGRAPTSGEYSQLLPAFQGPNGLMNGRAFLSNLAQQYKSNPRLDPSNPNNNQNPATVKSQISQQFQSILGRDATQDEVSHFAEAIQSGQTDAYGLASFLKTQPEYTNAKDKEFRGSLNSELEGYDKSSFDQNKGDIIADYAKRGFANSPSLDYALTDMLGKLAENRGKFLSTVSAQQYGSNKDLATGTYKSTVDRMYDEDRSRRSGYEEYGNKLLDRGFSGSDYLTQRDDLMNYMNGQPKYKPNVFDYLNAGTNVARGVGSFF